MSDKALHIVSFDIPDPPDYGGVIDIYYRIKILAEAGVLIHLHCFSYGREQSALLEKLCASVHYYPRKLYKGYLLMKKPFIAVSRQSRELVKQLAADDFPILFEGLHSCFHLNDHRLRHKKRMVRMHNVEHDYYDGLAAVENNPFKKFYFQSEARKLREFESVLRHADLIFSISENDRKYFSQRFPGKVQLLPAFHSNTTISFVEKKEKFAFYHGNLSVSENNDACLFLIREVFSKSKKRLVIAGNHPSRELRQEADKYANVEIKTGLNPESIRSWIQKAQINILPTFQNTGIKLKLLYALFNGGHVLVNPPMVRGTGLNDAVVICKDAESFRNSMEELMNIPFAPEMLNQRKLILDRHFNNQNNAEIILKEL